MFASPRTSRNYMSLPHSMSLRTSTRQQPRETYLNNQKREKLKEKLINRYISLYGALSNEAIIEKEVVTFLNRDKLTEKDLKDLEKTLKKKLTSENERLLLKSDLTSPVNNPTITLNPTDPLPPKETILPNINSHKSTGNIFTPPKNQSKPRPPSGMSGASELDNFDEHIPNDKQQEDRRNFKKVKELIKSSEISKPSIEIDYSKYNDEWDAINMINKHIFEQEKIKSRQKDWEMKQRTKADLDFQVKEKLLRKYNEKLKDKEIDIILDNHLKHLDELEAQRKKEIKEKLIKEKESRAQQVKDGEVRKKIEFLKNRKYERELVKSLNEAMVKEKQIEIDKKKQENEALKKTLKDNEIHKQKLLDEMKKERELNIKMIEDDAKMKERQENERILYFKNIERSSNSFAEEMVNTVLKNQQIKNAEEEKKLEEYYAFRDKQYDELEEKKLKSRKEKEMKIKEYLDKQVKEKLLRKQYEKEVDKAQARVWNKDCELNNIRIAETNKLIRDMNCENLKLLKSQMDMQKNKAKEEDRMNQYEKDINKDLLKQANELEGQK